MVDVDVNDSDKFYWIETDTTPTPNTHTIYVDGTLSSGILTGSASNITDAELVGADNDYVYWLTTADVLKRRKIGTTIDETIESSFDVKALVAENGYLLWIAADNSIRQGRVVATDSGLWLSTIGIIDNQTTSTSLAARDRIIYFNADNKLLKYGVGRLNDTFAHEFNSTQFTDFDRLYTISATSTKAYIDAMWRTHVFDAQKEDTPARCRHNRHSYAEPYWPNRLFTQTAANLIAAFVFMESKSQRHLCRELC
jgi:hypothetical protein